MIFPKIREGFSVRDDNLTDRWELGTLNELPFMKRKATPLMKFIFLQNRWNYPINSDSNFSQGAFSATDSNFAWDSHCGFWHTHKKQQQNFYVLEYCQI